MRAAAWRTSSTVVAVVGSPDVSHACVARLDHFATVASYSPPFDDAPLTRALSAWSAALASHAPYFAHDADPLAAVADAWVRYYDEAGPRGELEVAVTETLARWQPGAIELPDYFLVVDA